MTLFAAYLKERCNRELLEVPGVAFATYEISGEECYIVDIFVEKSHRRSKVATEIADQISNLAREKGCTYLKGSIDLTRNGARESCFALLSYGFKPMLAMNDAVYFRKEL